jgi:putative MATE family efflux protein
MQVQGRGEELGRERIGTVLRRLSVPGIVAMLVNSLYNVVDTIYVGQGIGSLAIGGLAVAFPLQMLVMGLSLLAGLGAASAVSRSLGSGNAETADVAAGNGLLLAGLLNAGYAAVGLAFTEPLLRAFGATDTLLAYAGPYTRIIMLGVVANGLTVAATTLAQSGGAARAAMASTIVGGILNVALDPVFIFGFRMGVAGAAWATIISQVASLAYIVMFLRSSRSPLHLALRHFAPNLGVMRDIVAVGTSAFLRSVGTTVFAMVVNNVLRVRGGDAAITIYGIVNRVISFLFLPSLGIVQAMQPIAGYNYGAGRLDRVHRVVLTSLAAAFAIGCIGWLIVELAPGLIVAAFTSETVMLRESGRVLRIVFAAEPLMALQLVASTLYQALGKAAPSAFLAMLRQFLVLTPLLLILPECGGLGLQGVWLSFPVANVVAGLIVSAMLIRELAVLRRRHRLATS